MERENNTNILSYLNIIARYKKMIVLSVMLLCILAVVYIMSVPKYWTAHATIKPVSSSSLGMPFSAGSLLGLGSSMLSNSQLTAHDFINIMNSRTFLEKVIAKFDLYTYFELEFEDPNLNRDKAINRLRTSVVNMDLNDITGMISISVETKDKKLSADIANYFWKELNIYNVNERIVNAKLSREFLEDRVLTITSNIDNLALQLKGIQAEYNIIELESQAKMLIENYSLLVSKLEEEKLKLDYIKIMFDTNDRMIEEQIAKIEVLKNTIDDFESDSDNNPLYQLKFSDIPEISYKYADLEMQLEMNKKVLEFIYPQYEAAKIDELKKTPSLEVIDDAVEAGLRSKPKRAMFCIVVFVLSFVFFTSLAFLIEAFKVSMKKKENIELFKELKSNLYAKK